ncbi:MAG TPA: hypothetical protein VF255_05620 [Solirubrobacterales bacterium]
MGRASKVIVVAALVALLALALAACGDDDGGDSQGSETTASVQESESQPAAAEFEPAPLQVSGEGADLREAAEAVHAFYVTRARGEWSETCSRIAQPLLEKLEGLAKQSEKKSCAEFLESFTTAMSNEEWREVTVMDAESLRLGGGQATLVYQGAAGKTYSVPLREEGGEWMMEALQGTTSA